MPKVKVWIVSAAYPDPNPTPSIPQIFTTASEAEAHLENEMRDEWEGNGPCSDESDENLPYPGNWRDAQTMIMADDLEASWGSYKLTTHEIDVPAPAVAAPIESFGDAEEACRSVQEYPRAIQSAANRRLGFDYRETATVLAALRYWQAAGANGEHVGQDILDIATSGDEIEALSPDEIDDLCERLNCEPAGSVPELAGKLAAALIALKRAEIALNDALTQHIYNEADGEKPEPECHYTAALADVRAAIRGAEGAANAKPEPAKPEPTVGARVRLTECVDNFPTCLIPAGETGTITEVTPECTWVRLDRTFPELLEWHNQVEIWHWPDANGAPFAVIAEGHSNA